LKLIAFSANSAISVSISTLLIPPLGSFDLSKNISLSIPKSVGEDIIMAKLVPFKIML
jgi:hypothetical protein